MAVMLVGEQPGDEEDRRGEPFVGPAGRLLRVRDDAEREAAFKSLVRDLALLRSTARATPARPQDRPGSSAPPSTPRRPLPSVRRGG
jgi:DNA polymerase